MYQYIEFCIGSMYVFIDWLSFHRFIWKHIFSETFTYKKHLSPIYFPIHTTWSCLIMSSQNSTMILFLRNLNTTMDRTQILYFDPKFCSDQLIFLTYEESFFIFMFFISFGKTHAIWILSFAGLSRRWCFDRLVQHILFFQGKVGTRLFCFGYLLIILVLARSESVVWFGRFS